MEEAAAWPGKEGARAHLTCQPKVHGGGQAAQVKALGISAHRLNTSTLQHFALLSKWLPNLLCLPEQHPSLPI